MIENLIFEKSRFKTSVFEEHFISYSCILFIKYYALRSFCINLLCFSKNCVFQIFDQLNLFLDWSKMRLKFRFEFARFDRCSIGSGSIEGIFDQLNLIFDQSKIAWRVFLKTFSFSRVQTLFQTFKALSLSTRSV